MSLIALLSGSVASAAPSYLFNDDVEYADNTAASANWTISGSPVFGYATPPAPLQGTYSVNFSASSQTIVRAFSSQSDVWAYFQTNVLTTASNTLNVAFRSSTPAVVASCLFVATGIVRANAGGGTSTSSSAGTVSAATTYHVWMHYVAGTGSNAIMAIYVSTDGIKPGTPTANRTAGTSTTAAVDIRFTTDNNGTIFDKIIVSATEIGDNPA